MQKGKKFDNCIKKVVLTKYFSPTGRVLYPRANFVERIPVIRRKSI